MLIWRGWGILIPIIFLVAISLGEAIVPGGLGAAIVVIAAGFLVWFWGKRLNHESKTQVVIDKETGREIKLTRPHDLFWIKMQYWAIPMWILGVLQILGVIIRSTS